MKVLIDDNKGSRAFELALRHFRKACDDVGIMDEIKERRFYEKPSAKKRRKKAERKRTLQRVNNGRRTD